MVTKDYNMLCNQYICESKKLGKPVGACTLKKYGLPSSSWFINHCSDKNVKSWSDFVKWCGCELHKESKKKTIEVIYKMQEQLNRPLMYDDFRGVDTYTHVSIRIIKKYWGSINKMKEELGLEIVQDCMNERTLTQNEFDDMIKEICDYVKADNRDFILTKEISQNNNWKHYNSLTRYAKVYYNTSVNNLLLKQGIHLGNKGDGLNYDFEDGEHTSSQYEYVFSKSLKECGLVYKKDYFRDIKYSSFINEYNGKMNCDYVINYNNQIIYIEIAGVLRDYKEQYYKNISLKRKSKEKYRQVLRKKEKMLNENNLTYFILFPSDIVGKNVNVKFVINSILNCK